MLGRVFLAGTLFPIAFWSGCTFPEPSPTDGRPTQSDTIIPGNDHEADDPIGPAGTGDPITLDVLVSPIFCCNPLSLDFSASVSDPNLADGVRFSWDFGDRRTGQGSTVRHTYNFAGLYYVTTFAVLADGREVAERRILELSLDPSGGSSIVVSPDGGPGAIGEFEVTAGEDQFVDAGDVVRLSASMVRGVSLDVTYSWTQIFGRTVGLSGLTGSTITFVAPSDGNNIETLTLRVTASDGRRVALADVRIIVSPPPALDVGPHAPNADDHLVFVEAGTAKTLNLTGSDPDGDDLTFRIVEPPLHGTVDEVNNTKQFSATVVYTADTVFVGSDSFQYLAEDATGTSRVATFRIDVLPDSTSAAALDRAFLVPINTPTTLTITGHAATGVDLAFAVTAPPRHGTLSVVNNTSSQSATVDYTPDAGYDGSDFFTFTASDGVRESLPGTITLDVNKRIIPWIEVNYPLANALSLYTPAQGAEPGMTVLDYCLAGLQHWSQITDTAIVTTTTGQIDRLYPDLIRRRPANLRIIGGIKSSTLPGATPGDSRSYDFANESGWAFIAGQVELIAELTGENVVVIENETALGPYFRGQATIDYARLGQSLSVLAATGVETWWWYPELRSGPSATSGVFEDSVRFVSAIRDALGNNRFLTTYFGWEGTTTNYGYVRLRQQMIDLVGPDRFQDGFFVAESGVVQLSTGPHDGYTPDQALAAMDKLPVQTVRIYPGGADWILVGQALARTLPPIGSGTQP